MATKYIDLSGNTTRKPKKETVITKVIGGDFRILDNTKLDYLNLWNNIAFLGHDKNYGDVFKLWDNDQPEDFAIAFGVKGDEFD